MSMIIVDRSTILLRIRYVLVKRFYLMPFVSANDTINEENTIKECMLLQVLVQVIMQEVECIIITIVTIHMVNENKFVLDSTLNVLDNYGYPPPVDDYSTDVNGQQNPTVFYCLQEDLNTTLVNKTLDAEGFGTCNVSGKLVTCPIEIECKTSEADNCCEGK